MSWEEGILGSGAYGRISFCPAGQCYTERMGTPVKRKWFRPVVGALLVVLTIVGIWLYWNDQVVLERTLALNIVQAQDGTILSEFDVHSTDHLQPISWIRRVLGDQRIAGISAKG